jgi:small-conductance mechanosensitive channel
MIRSRLCVLATTLVTLAAPLAAQTQPSDPPAADGAAAGTRALIDALRDEATRARLIEALEQDAAAASGAAPSAPVDEAATPDPQPGAPVGTVDPATGAPTGSESVGRANQPVILDHPGPSIGERVLQSAPEMIAETVSDVRRDLRRLRANLLRLSGLAEIDAAKGWGTAIGTLVLVGVSFGIVLLGRAALAPVFRHIERAAGSATARRKFWLGFLSILVDLGLLALASFGALVAAALLGATHAGEVPPRQYHYFYAFAFLYAGVLAVALRAALSPRTDLLRPLPMGTRSARYWTWHISAVIGIAVFGELFVRQVIVELTDPVTADAATVAFHVAGAAYVAVLIIANRNAPVVWTKALSEAQPDKAGLAILAALSRFWTVPALVAVGWILNTAIISSHEALPLIGRLVAVIVSLAAAALLITVLNHFAHRGVVLSPSFKQSIPNLEPRLAVFVPAFLRFLRYLIVLVWLGYALRLLGLADPWSWFESRYGFDFAGAITSLVIIVLVCYAAWLAITSWIDYRLRPDEKYEPTPRQQTLFSLLRNAVLVGILLLGMSYALASFGVSVAPLLASAGVVGLAIGFGSQKLVQDIINGLFIQFESAISVGDVVELGGRIGVVEKLTIRSVSLRDVQGVLHIIPFSSVDSVSNHTMGYSYHVADMSVAYGADLDVAKDEMLAAYDDLKNDFAWGSKLLGGVEWFGVQALGDNAVILRSRIKTRPGEQWGVGRAYAERVKRRFDAAGIEIPFPQMKLWYDRERPPPGPLGPPTPPRPSGGPTDADGDVDGR